MFTYAGQIEELQHLLVTIKESYAAFDDWNVSSCLNNLALLYQSREEDYERALLFQLADAKLSYRLGSLDGAATALGHASELVRLCGSDDPVQIQESYECALLGVRCQFRSIPDCSGTVSIPAQHRSFDGTDIPDPSASAAGPAAATSAALYFYWEAAEAILEMEILTPASLAQMERACALTEQCFAERVQRESDADTLFRAAFTMTVFQKFVRANSVMAILQKTLQAQARSGSSRAANVARKFRVLDYFLRVFRPQTTGSFEERPHIDFYSQILINLNSSDSEDVKDVYEELLDRAISEYPGGRALAAKVLALLRSGHCQRHDYSYFTELLESAVEEDELINALQSALYDADPVPGLIQLVQSGNEESQIIEIFVERFGKSVDSFNLSALLLCVFQYLGPPDEYQEIRKVLVYQLAGLIDGVPGLDFSVLEPVLKRFLAQTQPQLLTVSANVIVQTSFDRAREDPAIRPAFDAVNQNLVELSPSFDLDDFMVRQSGLIARENVRNKSQKGSDQPATKNILKIKPKRDRRAPYAPTPTRISEQDLSLTLASDLGSQIVAGDRTKENLRMNTWLTEDPAARKNRLLKALQVARSEEEICICNLFWVPTEALSALRFCMCVRSLRIEGQFEDREAGVGALTQSIRTMAGLRQLELIDVGLTLNQLCAVLAAALDSCTLQQFSCQLVDPLFYESDPDVDIKKLAPLQKKEYHVQRLDLSYCVFNPKSCLPREFQAVVINVDTLVLKNAKHVDTVFGKTLVFKQLEQ